MDDRYHISYDEAAALRPGAWLLVHRGDEQHTMLLLQDPKVTANNIYFCCWDPFAENDNLRLKSFTLVDIASYFNEGVSDRRCDHRAVSLHVPQLTTRNVALRIGGRKYSK